MRKTSEFVFSILDEIVLSQCYSMSCVRLFVTPWTVACQAPLSIDFSRQDYWSGLPFPFPGDLPDLGPNPGLLYCRRVIYCLSHQRQEKNLYVRKKHVVFCGPDFLTSFFFHLLFLYLIRSWKRNLPCGEGCGRGDQEGEHM